MSTSGSPDALDTLSLGVFRAHCPLGGFFGVQLLPRSLITLSQSGEPWRLGSEIGQLWVPVVACLEKVKFAVGGEQSQ